MSPDSKLVKVGQWGDRTGLQMPGRPFVHRDRTPNNLNVRYCFFRRPRFLCPSYPREVPPSNRNRTFVLTTVLEEPFMMLKDDVNLYDGNDRFEGYCKDLAELIAERAQVHFVIRPVRDGRYGNPDPDAPGI